MKICICIFCPEPYFMCLFNLHIFFFNSNFTGLDFEWQWQAKKGLCPSVVFSPCRFDTFVFSHLSLNQGLSVFCFFWALDQFWPVFTLRSEWTLNSLLSFCIVNKKNQVDYNLFWKNSTSGCSLFLCIVK